MEKKLIGSHTVIYIGGGNSSWITESYATCYRTFHKEVILAKTDGETLWTEWTDAQKAAWEKKHDEPFRDNDLVEQARTAGAVPNFKTGYYELNTLTDITEQQMRDILYYTTGRDRGTASGATVDYYYAKCRTNVPARFNMFNYSVNFNFYQCDFEVVALEPKSKWGEVVRIANAFDWYGCGKLRKVIGTIVPTGNFHNSPVRWMPYLEEITIKGLSKSFRFFSDSPKLNSSSWRCMIENRTGANTITLTMPKSTFDKVNDPDNGEWYPLLALADEHNVVLATTE